MKKLIILLITVFALFSCQKENETIEPSNPLTEAQIEIAINSFKNSIIPKIELFDSLMEYQNIHLGGVKSGSYPDVVLSLVETLVSDLAQPSLNFFEELGFVDEHFNEIFSELDPYYFDHYITGTALILSNLLNSDAGSDAVFGSSVEEQGIAYCFKEATGIAAGIALVIALAKAASTEEIVDAVKKLVKKVGKRTLGGIGLVLIGAQFTLCMRNN